MAVTLSGLNAFDPATPGGVSTGAGPAPASAAGPAAAAGGSQPGGEVALTSLSTRLSELERSLTTSSPVSDAKVQAVSAALAAGTYNIDPQGIAAGLAQSEQLLGQLPLSEEV